MHTCIGIKNSSAPNKPIAIREIGDGDVSGMREMAEEVVMAMAMAEEVEIVMVMAEEVEIAMVMSEEVEMVMGWVVYGNHYEPMEI